MGCLSKHCWNWFKMSFLSGIADAGRHYYLLWQTWKEQDAVLQFVLVQPLRMMIADELTQARIHFQTLMQWVRMRKVTALTFVSQGSWEWEKLKLLGPTSDVYVLDQYPGTGRRNYVSFPLFLHITLTAVEALLSQHKEVSIWDRQVTTLLGCCSSKKFLLY